MVFCVIILFCALFSFVAGIVYNKKMGDNKKDIISVDGDDRI